MNINASEAGPKVVDKMDCDLIAQILQKRSLLLHPTAAQLLLQRMITESYNPNGAKGGLVTALTGLANLTDAHWIASAQTGRRPAVEGWAGGFGWK